MCPFGPFIGERVRTYNDPLMELSETFYAAVGRKFAKHTKKCFLQFEEGQIGKKVRGPVWSFWYLNQPSRSDFSSIQFQGCYWSWEKWEVFGGNSRFGFYPPIFNSLCISIKSNSNRFKIIFSAHNTKTGVIKSRKLDISQYQLIGSIYWIY